MSYKGAVPNSNVSLASSVSPSIVSFFETFYAISDDPSTHEEYAQSLTPTADLIMGTKRAKGYDEILALRKANWAGPITSRKHVLEKIFAFAPNEVMVYGYVTYGLRNGKEVKVEWGGRAVFEGKGDQSTETNSGGGVEEKEKLRMQFYQVYLDSAPVVEAAKN